MTMGFRSFAAAGFWYDGDDAEIMTIGIGRSFQRRELRRGVSCNP